MSAQQHRERQRQRVDTLEDCLRQRDQEIAKLKGEVRVPCKNARCWYSCFGGGGSVVDVAIVGTDVDVDIFVVDGGII